MNFQIGLIIFVAKYLANNEKKCPVLKRYFTYSNSYFSILLAIMLEPDFGTGMVIVGSLIGMIFVSNIHLNFFAYAAVTGAGMAALIIAAPYR